MPNGSKTAAKATTSTKRGFWIRDDQYERVQLYVSKHRNAPDDMSINKFVREALEEKLTRIERARARA